VALNN